MSPHNLVPANTVSLAAAAASAAAAAAAVATSQTNHGRRGARSRETAAPSARSARSPAAASSPARWRGARSASTPCAAGLAAGARYAVRTSTPEAGPPSAWRIRWFSPRRSPRRRSWRRCPSRRCTRESPPTPARTFTAGFLCRVSHHVPRRCVPPGFHFNLPASPALAHAVLPPRSSANRLPFPPPVESPSPRRCLLHSSGMPYQTRSS